jgi:hypothetical protein
VGKDSHTAIRRSEAVGLGLSKDVVVAIEKRVLVAFEREAEQLTEAPRWHALLMAELVEKRGAKTVRVLPPVNYRIRQASTDFGLELSRLLGEMIVKLSGELAQAIAFRQEFQDPIHWKQIVAEAAAFASVQIDWERSRWWLARMLQNGGYVKREIHPTIRVAFMTVLGGVYIGQGIIQAQNEIQYRARTLHKDTVGAFARVAHRQATGRSSILKDAIRRARRENPNASQEDIAEGADRILKAGFRARIGETNTARAECILFRKVCPKTWLIKNNHIQSLVSALRATELKARVRAYISKIRN